MYVPSLNQHGGEPVEPKTEHQPTTPDTRSDGEVETPKLTPDTRSGGEDKARKPELGGKSNTTRHQQDKVSLFHCDNIMLSQCWIKTDACFVV